jgi:hypothetical protein
MALTVGSQAAGQFLYNSLVFVNLVLLHRIFQRQSRVRLMLIDLWNGFLRLIHGVEGGNISRISNRVILSLRTFTSGIRLGISLSAMTNETSCPCIAWIEYRN